METGRELRLLLAIGVLGFGATARWAEDKSVLGGLADHPAAAEYVVTDGDRELRVRATGVQQWLDDGATFGVYSDVYGNGGPHELTRATYAGYEIVTINGCASFLGLKASGAKGPAGGTVAINGQPAGAWSAGLAEPYGQPMDYIAVAVCRWGALKRDGRLPGALAVEPVMIDFRDLLRERDAKRARALQEAKKEAASPIDENPRVSDAALVANVAAVEPQAAVWTNVFDQGRALTFFNINRPCPWGKKFGVAAFVIAPLSSMRALTGGSALACVDIARVNARYQKIWTYVPGEEVAEGVVGGGLGLYGHEFSIKQLPHPDKASRHLTPLIIDSLRQRATRHHADGALSSGQAH